VVSDTTHNEYARIENDEIILQKLSRRPLPDGVQTLERAFQERMPHLHLLDILSETDHWLRWTRHFGPLSGFEAKLDRPGSSLACPQLPQTTKTRLTRA